MQDEIHQLSVRVADLERGRQRVQDRFARRLVRGNGVDHGAGDTPVAEGLFDDGEIYVRADQRHA